MTTPANQTYLPFGGSTYDARRDGKRLGKQMRAVRDLMLELEDWEWVTLSDISNASGYPEASISARLRDLRKDAFGGYRVDRRRRAGAGTWEYRVRP